MTETKPKYQNLGSVGAMGDNARSDGNTFVQTAAAASGDLAELAKQLAQVRAEMKKRSSSDDPSQDAEIGVVAQAESAAKSGDRPKTLGFLKKAGKWTLDVAKSITAELVKDAIEGKLGS